HEHQILYPDAVFAGLVIAGLVREDHAGEQFLLRPGLPAARLGDALRPFVNGEEAADSVAGAVRVIEPGLPQELARQGIELRAAGARREGLQGEADVALEHAGEAIALLRRRSAAAVLVPDPYGAGDVGGAIGILAA